MKGNEGFLQVGVMFSLMFIIASIIFGIISGSLVSFLDYSTTGLLMGTVVCIASLLLYWVSCIGETKSALINNANSNELPVTICPLSADNVNNTNLEVEDGM